MKVLADHHSLDPDIRERFIAEARLLRRLTSPHVVRLHELDETEQRQPFHVLEYVAGGNLATFRRSMLAAGRRVTSDDVRHVARDLTTALTVLHAARVVHRDLAPKNLLVRRCPTEGETTLGGPGLFVPGDQLVLADLGISKDLAESSGLTAAAGNSRVRGARAAGGRDRRRAGRCLRRLGRGGMADHGERPTDAVAADVRRRGSTPGSATCWLGGLADDPNDRPRTIDEWYDAVTAALSPPPPPSPCRHRRWRWRLRRCLPRAGRGGDRGRSGRCCVARRRRSGLVDGWRRERCRPLDHVHRRRRHGAGAASKGRSRWSSRDRRSSWSASRARFTATVSGTDDWTWFGADGQQLAGTDAIDLDPTAPGALRCDWSPSGRRDDTATAIATLTVTDP